MSTITKEFTKEQLIEHIKGRKEFADECAADSTLHPERREYYELTAEALRFALASLEAEPVCYLTWHQGFRAPDDCEEYVVEAKPGDKSCDGSPAFPVYTAPPAPVSVPDEYVAAVPTPTNLGYEAGWNACRAAMLHGAENVKSRCTIQAAPALDSSPKNAQSRCSNFPVIPEGWQLVPKQITLEMECALSRADSYEIGWRWALAAAPQQEVTQALAKGMERYGDAMRELAKKEVKP